jgi:hypothetical protein
MENYFHIGLIKFFEAEAHLDSFLNGFLRFNTPEKYRLSEQKGVSDSHESCQLAYRKSREDDPIKVFIDGEGIDRIEIKEVTALTVGKGSNDRWLQCWTILKIPKDSDELAQFGADINRMRTEFGIHFALLQNSKISEYVMRIRNLTHHSVESGAITYADDINEWGIFCKSSSYKYQREFRFTVGECNHLSQVPLEIKCGNGFKDLITKNPTVYILEETSNKEIFHLSPEKCEFNL